MMTILMSILLCACAKCIAHDRNIEHQSFLEVTTSMISDLSPPLLKVEYEEDLDETVTVESESILPEPEPESAYTDEELEILAIIIYQEAGGDACSNETRLMVGNVFLNRVADDRFPNTFLEVATQKRQYGRLYWTGLQWPERAQLDVEAHAVKRAYEIAKHLLEGERVLAEDVIFQSEYILGEIVAYRDGFYFCK